MNVVLMSREHVFYVLGKLVMVETSELLFIYVYKCILNFHNI